MTSLVTGLGEHKIRLISPEVGGGFGSKTPLYADEMVAVFCAMKLGRPVKWTETRSETFRPRYTAGITWSMWSWRLPGRAR